RRIPECFSALVLEPLQPGGIFNQSTSPGLVKTATTIIFRLLNIRETNILSGLHVLEYLHEWPKQVVSGSQPPHNLLGSVCTPTYAAGPASRIATLLSSIGRTGSVDHMLSKVDPQRPNLTPGRLGTTYNLPWPPASGPYESQSRARNQNAPAARHRLGVVKFCARGAAKVLDWPSQRRQ
ncbi:unnamed protein product, partial [Ectocarpus sp. 4 AP-2014]